MSVEVSVVIPVRNETKYIKKCIESIIIQDYPKDKIEVIFVDGSSHDNTTEIIKKYIEKYHYIRLLNNPRKFVQYALNIGMKASQGKYIVRMDAHSEYACDYISSCIKVLEETGASNVGGPMNACSEGSDNKVQAAAAAAYHSEFALGGGKNHDSGYEGYADTVFLGAFRKTDIEKMGYYDERLIRNEDDDLNFRMIENGMKIFITPKIKSIYYPRCDYSALFKQYFEYGMWKVAVIKKHGKPARISHLVPLIFVLFLSIFGIASFFSKTIRLIFLAVMLLYLGLDIYFSFKSKKVKTLSDRFRLMLIHLILHIAYGFGFLVGIFKFWNFK